MSLVLALALALQAREEVVAVPKTDVKVAVVPVPVDGTALRPFALGKHETTWAELQPLMKLEPADPRIDGLTRPSSVEGLLDQMGLPAEALGPERPASTLRWHTATAYCDWLTAGTGRKFRLPTEPEWEQGAKSESGLKNMLGSVWELCLEPMAAPDFGPVYRGGSRQTPAGQLALGLRSGVRPEWFELDATRPRSSWWLFGGSAQGMRPALVGDEAAMKESADYAPKLEVRILGSEERKVQLGGRSFEFVVAVRGEVRNGGDRTIDELELRVFNLDPKGGPHWVDREGNSLPGRPTYACAFPVLANSAFDAPRRPLGPGETRAFSVDVPKTFDPDVFVNENEFGARTTWVRLAPR